MFVLNDVLRRAALINADGAALLTDEGTISWSQLLRRVRIIAAALQARGLRHGDRVAIMAMNGPRYYEFLFAVIWAGGIAVPVNTRFSDRELLGCLDDLQNPWLCTDDALLTTVERLRGSPGAYLGLLHIGHAPAPPDYVGYDTLLAGAEPTHESDPENDDVALIYYTGGTTGASKGVMMTHAQVLQTAQLLAAALQAGQALTAQSVYVHAAPMFHMADGAMCFTTAVVACANSFMVRFDVSAFIAHAHRHGVSFATLVPTMIKTLCDHLRAQQLTLPGLHAILYGGAPMPRPTLDLAMATLPGVRLFQGYGSTEALIISTLDPEFHTLGESHRSVLRSAGRPLNGVLLRIADPEGRELPRGVVGEICVRSNSVMKGYWRQPELTAQCLRDNWFHTGDAGYLDEQGFLFIVDRVKDMVITGGENVYPKEVENALLTCAHVDECAVIGLPDEVWGEVVHAVVRLKDGATLDATALTMHCRALIAGYKVPKSYEFSDQQLPRTPAGKIDKAGLRRARLA